MPLFSKRLFSTFLIAILASHCAGLHALETLAAEVNVKQTRADFLKLIDRPRVPLAPEVQDLPNVGDCIQQHFTYASDAEQRVPGILLKPSGNDEPKRGVIILLHGTGGKKESNLGLMKTLCAKGFIGVAIDGRYHGERTKAGGGDAEYCEAIYRAYKTGKEHPLYFDTAWDIMRLIDYLETRPDVDPKRIGIMGFSKGGIETVFAAAADPRIAVVIPCIGVQSFHWGLDNGAWKARLGTVQKAAAAISQDDGTPIDAAFARKFFDRLVPGIYGEFDHPALLQLIAPRPMLVINGDSDDKTPIPGLMEAADAAKSAYHTANVDEKFVLRIQANTGHSVNAESQTAATEWFAKWLSNK